jgi:transposase InsO family protein
MVSVGTGQDGDTVAPHHVRLQERDREVFRTVKEEKTRRFYNNNLPSDRLDNLESFLNLFMLWYNHLRRHQGLGRVPVEVMLS